jgi:hypothetical protein
MKRLTLPTGLLVAALVLGCRPAEPIRDDAMLAGLTAADFPQLTADVFHDLDQGVELSPAAITGRNSWILWTGGSQVFIDWLAREGYGISDTLKMLDSRRRGDRFQQLGLMNEPGFTTPDRPDAYGIWLDVPAGGAARGAVDAAIAEAGIDERVYGRSTGVFGLRLFPNPNFDHDAAARWDPKRYYDPDDPYSRDPSLVRPYRVGMTCGLCHVAPNPLRPPPDPNAPGWENLVSILGNQYFREGRVFASNLTAPPADSAEPSSFLWEILNAQPPGTSDTSRMATDHVNNPNAINAIFNVDARLAVARTNPTALEPASAASHHLPGVGANDGFVPHVLKDGADSVGIAGAILRVYVNIGTFSQYWLTLHEPLVGIRYQQPFEVAYAHANSTYWRATEERIPNLVEFFRSVRPYHLRDAVWTDGGGVRHTGAEVITADAELLRRGKGVFARNCARCHSSKRPPDESDLRSEATADWFEQSVLADDFLDDNFLSEDRRHRVDYVGTNACRALGTNAKRGRIWDNFSSETYQGLAAVEKITLYNPFTGVDQNLDFDLQARGVRHSVGYYRTPSLISVWTSAPLLHTNALGTYTGDPSVPGRLAAFDDAIEKLLWPEKRAGVASIWRTSRDSEIRIPLSVLPEVVQTALRSAGIVTTGAGQVEVASLGPIPAGTPINLLASLDLSLGSLADAKKAAKLAQLAGDVRAALRAVRDPALTAEQRFALMKERLLRPLMDNNNCPDLVEDRGHPFGTDLADDDKRALIEFLRTL